MSSNMTVVVESSLTLKPTSYLTLSPGISFGTGAYTVELWLRTASAIHGGDILGNSGDNWSYSFILDSPTRLHVDAYQLNAHNFDIPAASALQPNTWYHIAIARNASSSEALWINGTRIGLVSDPDNYSKANGINTAQCTWCVPSSSVFNGEQISNMRVVVGNNIYDPNSTTITVPNQPLSALPGTQ
jgi:hypothetical protein